MIADLQLHVCHRRKVFLALTLALALVSSFWLWLWLWSMALALAQALAQALDLALALAMAFLMNEAEKLTKGSVHEDVQYALVLMAEKETIKLMKQKGYLHHSPEFMPLYNILNSLNRDILKSLRFLFF